MKTIVIAAAKRTPVGAFMGVLSPLKAPELASHAIRAAVAASTLKPELVDEVIMGCVLPAGLGQSPTRQAALGANLPLHAGVTTINKVCGSGMKAVMLANDLIRAESAKAIVAGGMESMSNAPYLLPKAREGYRMGHGNMMDHMMLDGLENAYDGKAMGCFAQDTADAENITREAMDNFAITSLNKAKHAVTSGHFHNEITPITIANKKGDITVSEDETPQKARPEKIPHLKPAFSREGTVTAANSSSISDGAAALVVTDEAFAKAHKLPVLAKIVGHSTHAIAPEDFTIAPIGAIEKLLQKIEWKKEDVDLFEINEAFAMVTMLAIDKLGLPSEKVNIHGGACALGHPIGASGARIIVTLIHALKQRNLSKGIAALCIGGGEATAIAVEVE